MPRTARLLLAPLALLALLACAPTGTAHAAKSATFTGVFEAERTVIWKQPRGVFRRDCRGDHWYEAGGSDTMKIKTRRPFKVTVQSLGGHQIWTFGKGATVDPLRMGFEAGGMTKRELKQSGGTTGGWCGGGDPNPKLEDDCGTRLPTWLVMLHASAGKLTFDLGFAPWMQKERLSYYDCTLITPDGMADASFGATTATFRAKDVFSKKKRTIVISRSKGYGPDAWPVPNFDNVTRTASGKESFKLTLTRTK